jgi:hypothetical protein
MYRSQRFPTGLTFQSRHQPRKTYEIIDVLRTYNSAGEMVEMRYVTQHTLCGQGVRSTMVDTEIARSLDATIFESYKDKDFTVKVNN